jgi:hypothetical protein
MAALLPTDLPMVSDPEGLMVSDPEGLTPTTPYSHGVRPGGSDTYYGPVAFGKLSVEGK